MEAGMATDADSDLLRLRHYNLRDGHGRRLVAVFATAMAVSTLIVSSRIFTRKRVLKAVGWDDLRLGLHFNVYCAMGVYAVHHLALGKHADFVPLDDIYYINVLFPKFVFIADLIYFTAMMFARASVILLVLRLQPTSRMVIAYKTVFGLNIAGYIARMCFTIFRCTKPSLVWSGLDLSNNPNCFILHNVLIFAMVGPVINMALDILVYTLPLQLLLKPGLHFKKRAAIAVSFLVGILSLLGSIMIVKMASAALNENTLEWDFMPKNTYMVMGELLMWPAIEAHVACICASLPVLGPLHYRFYSLIWAKVSLKGSGASEKDLPVESSDSSVNNNNGPKPKGRFEAYGVSDDMLETRRDSICISPAGDDRHV